MSNDHQDEHEARIQKRLMGLSIALIVVIGIVSYLLLMPAWYQNYAPEQPIPFSHALHAGQYKVPCLYCHSSAEHAQFAAVPGVETCMNCHSVVLPESPWIQKIKEAYNTQKPIAWVKVHVLPDFVYFNHARHVHAGVQCQTCHGPVEEMERVYQYERLTMGWCMSCHRDNNYLTPAREAFFERRDELQGGGTGFAKASNEWITLIGGHQQPYNADISCSTCHR